ncbi:phosphoribosyltransferase [Candidatus Nomurabacteria bacterium]|nr:phosphoribosyltransferase [Candidatus Nomurabacteria bacterium]
MNMNKMEKLPNKMIYLDQVRSALTEFEGLVLPNFAIEKAIRETLDNLSDAYKEFKFEIVHKDAEQLASNVTKEVRGKGAIYLDYHAFRNAISKIESAPFDVSRGRLYPTQLVKGMGPVTGKGENIGLQREQLTEKFYGKEVVLLDDLLTTGWTFSRVVPYLTDAGIKVCAIGVTITNKPEDEFEISGKKLPVYAGYQLDPAKDVEAYELKNFLAVPGSGAPHLKGSVTDSEQILQISNSLKKYLSNKDKDQLRSEIFTLQLEFNDGELMNKVSQIVGSEANMEELIDVLRSVQLPNFKPDIVGSSRSMYIGDYHSLAWRMTGEMWKEFSKRQIETSIRLYEEIRNTNAQSVTVGQLGIFNEGSRLAKSC